MINLKCAKLYSIVKPRTDGAHSLLMAKGAYNIYVDDELLEQHSDETSLLIDQIYLSLNNINEYERPNSKTFYNFYLDTQNRFNKQLHADRQHHFPSFLD